jgi:hypothetical protein
MPRFLCRLGLHKWRYEDAVITSLSEYESARGRAWVIAKMGKIPSIGIPKSVRTQTVFSKRECQKCGIKEGKRFAEDDQGNKTPISGWEKTT